ncbi:MAG: hypothetical protein OFPII_34930 [Osedax symbiont Rs1]|nr:MAG: hypothetical protein OFPII_34930 [Osedax symbiont Rs1]
MQLHIINFRSVVFTFLIFNLTELAALENDFSDDLPTVISASRLTQSVRNSPSSVTVIDKAMITASGFTEIVDLLRLVPGFQVAHVDGRRETVVYHGNGWEYPNRLQVLVNGRSTYLPTISTIDWNSIGVHIKDIERIEVVRGPSASAYGSNSFSAAINIITIAPELDHHYQFQSLVGTHGTKDVVFRTSDSGENFSYRVTGSYKRSAGFDYFPDSKDFKSLSFHGRYNLTPLDTLDLYLDNIDGKTDAGKIAFVKPVDRTVTTWSGMLKWQRILSQQEELTVNLSHTYYDENDQSETELLSSILGVTPAAFFFSTGVPDQTLQAGTQTNRSTKTDIEIQYNQSRESGVQFVLGAGYRIETLRSEFYFPDKGKITDQPYRFFANGQFPLTDSLIANTGIIYEDSPDTKGYWSPRASLNWHFKSTQSLRLSMSQAYRIPSILEREVDSKTVFSNGLVFDKRLYSAANLAAEKITSIELGYTGQLTNLPITWELKAYKEKISDSIIAAKDNSIIDLVGDQGRVVTNGGSYTSQGVEGEFIYRPSANSFLRFNFNRGTGRDNSQLQNNSQPLMTTPKTSYGILASHKIADWQFNAGLYHVGAMEWLSQGDLVESYTRLDAGISKSIKLSAKQVLTLKIGAQNINNRYYEFNNDLATEPKFYLSVDISEF